MNQHRSILIYLIISILISLTIPIQSYSNTNDDHLLTKLGINGVFEKSLSDYRFYSIQKYIVGKYSINYSMNYAQVVIDNYDEYRLEYGEPELPFKTFVFKLPRRTKLIDIGVFNIEFSVEKTNSIIKSSSQVIIQDIGYQDKYRYNDALSVLNESIYGLNKYYPGKLFDYVTGVDREYRYVYVWFYPVQYNPVKQQLVIIKRAEIIVAYDYENTVVERHLPDQLVNANYIVITSSKLCSQARRLADFYNERGVNTTVVTIDWIYENYGEAENITMYRGFYNNPFAGFRIDEYYEELRLKYNWSLALKTISFLRNISEYSLATHVLIFGSAETIPPSFYYLSAVLYSYDNWNGWIPTDIFYASPDYDLFPELLVGRIPVNNLDEAEKIVDKIISWYNAVEQDSSWFRNAVLAGGYAPGSIYLHSELFIQKMIRDGVLDRLYTRTLFRIDNMLNKTTVLSVLSGGYGWFILLTPGLGDAFVDVVIREGLRDPELDLLADIFDIQSLTFNPRVSIILSTASMNSAWDTDLLIPPFYYFTPPSIGKELLLSNAASICYIGSSRATLLNTLYEFSYGFIGLRENGAPKLLSKILEAYNSATSNKITLGEIFWKGIREYFRTTHMSEYVLTTIMEYSPFLGDPYLTLPVFNKIERSVFNIYTIYNLSEGDYVNAEIMFLQSFGKIPLVPSVRKFINLTLIIGGVIPQNIVVQIYRIYGWRINREDLCKIVFISEKYYSVSKMGREGYAYPYIELSNTVTGIILVRLKTPDQELRLYVISYGFTHYPEEACAGSFVYINAFGLDAFYPPGTLATITFNGVFMGYFTLGGDGSIRAPVLIPIVEPGYYTITISFPREYLIDLTIFPVNIAFHIEVTMSKTFSEIIENIIYLNNTLIEFRNNMTDVLKYLEELNASYSRVLETIDQRITSELRDLREASSVLIKDAAERLKTYIEIYEARISSIEKNVNESLFRIIINSVLVIVNLLMIAFLIILYWGVK